LFIKYRKGVIAILIIDRIEGNWAVIEFEGETFNIPINLLPQNAKEGDVINIIISVDSKATSERRNNIEKLMDELFED
jgi:hypothetical protein